MKSAILKSVLMMPVLFVFMAIGSAAFADILIENRTGIIKVTTPPPDSVVTEYGPNDELPTIPEGSLIDVVTGGSLISVTGDSEVEILICGCVATLSNEASVFVEEDKATGSPTLIVENGIIDAVCSDGKTDILGPGGLLECYPIPALVVPFDDTQLGRQEDIRSGAIKTTSP